MSKQKRWIATLVETSKSETPALPWQRGKIRNQMIAKRAARKAKVA